MSRRGQKAERTAAIVTVFRAEEMTPRGRRDIARWLQKQAALLLAHSDQLAGRYTARYLYR